MGETEQTHNGSGDNIGRDKHEHYHYPKYNIPNQLTTHLGEFPNFKGRKKECIELTRKLNEHKAVVVHGIGGLGKSSFVSSYLDKHKNEFQYYGFINWTNNIKLDLYNALQVNMKLDSYDNIDKNFNEVIRKLGSLKGKKLLIIDRIEDKEIDYREEEKSIKNILTLIDKDYKIIFASRFKIKPVTFYPLKVLSLKDAKEVFFIYYETDENRKVNDICKYLDYHPLFIKLVAETLKVTSFEIDVILNKFNTGELSKIEFIDEYTMDTVSFNQNLKVLFDMQKISKDGLLLLKQFSALPSIGIEFTFLQKILDKDELLKNRLNILVTHGWLILDKENYKLHQIIKEYIIKNHPSSFDEIKEIFKYFFHLTENVININVSIENRKNLIFFDSLYQITKDFKYIELVAFYMKIGIIYKELAFYEKALFFGKLSVKVSNFIRNSIAEEDEIIMKNFSLLQASCYNNLSQIYYQLGKYKRVFILDNKCLNIRKTILSENHISIIQSYNNLAQLHKMCGNNKKAKEDFEKAIGLIGKIKKVTNEDIDSFIQEKTVLYNNYALFVDKIEKNSKLAIKFAEKSIGIYKNQYNQLDSTYATFAFNLAIIYENNNKFIKAKRLYETVLQIKIDTFGEEHNDVASAYMGLATFYMKFNATDGSKAIKYMNKALDIYINIYKSEKHQNIALCYDNLGTIYSLCRDYDNAKLFSLKGLTLSLEILGNQHPQTLTNYKNVIISFFYLNDFQKMFFYLKELLNVFPNCLDKYNTDFILSLSELPENSKFAESLITLIGEIINKIKI